MEEEYIEEESLLNNIKVEDFEDELEDEEHLLLNKNEGEVLGKSKKKNIFSILEKFKLKELLLILCLVLIIVPLFSLKKKKTSKQSNTGKQIIQNNLNIDIDEDFVFTKGQPRVDKYGIDLNANILKGMYNIGIDNDPDKKIEDWSLYTPPCPNLRPIRHSDYVMNPKCESSSLQFVNYDSKIPITLPLNDISNQMDKFKHWKSFNNTNPYYGEQDYRQLLSEEYHPYDYGYNGEVTNDKDDESYYKEVINSRMDEVPDPRRRRLFSFILFNTEFDMLDLYLSEYYNIIDYFVIYESNSTFSGLPKPLYFTRTLLETDRYDKYKDKLIPLPCEIIVNEDNGRGTALPKEHMARREVIEKGLRSVQARHGDLFIHSDLDEMPKAHILTRLKKCGGWEHLQSGIGGAPKSFKNDNVDTYFINEKMNVTLNVDGEYMVNYINEISLGFLAWSYEYSYNLVESKIMGTVPHPNLVIFDARRSLGQLPEWDNYYELNNVSVQKRSNYDPLLDPNFDPYQGYTYSVHFTDNKIGKGFLGERVRFDTSKIQLMVNNTRPLLWNGSWHMSSFLPTLNLFYNKVKSYSHYNTFSGDERKDKIKILTRIRQHKYIFGRSKRYYTNVPRLPSSYTDGYNYNFDYSYWKEMSKRENFWYNSDFRSYVSTLKHEVPTQVWKNPICYSYMLDRRYGLGKRLWWQRFSKRRWKSIRFDKLKPSIINKITPKIIPESFKKEMLKEISNENN